VPGQAPQEMDPELVRVQTLLMEHQKTAARLTAAEEARTLVYYSQGLGVLGTNSQASSPLAGYPASAMVGFAVDEQGRPIFSFSSISTHKQDLIKDPRGSFTVASKVRGVGDAFCIIHLFICLFIFIYLFVRGGCVVALGQRNYQ